MSRRSAPRRKVVEIWHTTGWGTSIWYHKLECGHVEERKRRGLAEAIGCTRCESISGLDLQAPLGDTVVPPVELVDESIAVMRVKLGIAMNIPADSVSIEVRDEKVAGAMVFLDASQVMSLLRSDSAAS